MAPIPTAPVAAQLPGLGLGFILSFLIGLEREVRQKNAGLRTHTLVGVGATLIMLISKYGFSDVVTSGLVRVDPSRVAAQIVSGLGFIGGGVIFVRRDVVRGLTTAASIWFTAGVGMACGAGLFILAAATAALYFVVSLAFPLFEQRLSGSRHEAATLRIQYEEARTPLRAILTRCADLGFDVNHIRLDPDDEARGERPEPAVTILQIEVSGRRPVRQLIARLSDVDGVRDVGTSGPDEEGG